MTNIGVIGAGKISHRHTEALNNIDGVRIAAIADINYDRARRLSDEYQASVYNDYIEMINKEQLEGVIINLPHKLHKICTKECAARGINILVEKPMAVNARECEEMIEAAKENQVKLMIAHIQRYFPENIKAKEIIESGKLGTLTSIVDERNMYYFSTERPSWFLDKEMSGGGIMMNFGAHSIDKILSLTGSKIDKVVGACGNAMTEYEIEGHAQALIKLENNVTATINFSGYKQFPINETNIHMTNGSLKLETGKGLWIYEGDEYKQVPIENKHNPFQLQMNDFINLIREEKHIETSGDYGKSIIEAIEKIYEI